MQTFDYDLSMISSFVPLSLSSVRFVVFPYVVVFIRFCRLFGNVNFWTCGRFNFCRLCVIIAFSMIFSCLVVFVVYLIMSFFRFVVVFGLLFCVIVVLLVYLVYVMISFHYLFRLRCIVVSC